MGEDRMMEGISDPSIDDDKCHRQKSDVDQQQIQLTLIDVELNSMSTSAGHIYGWSKFRLMIDTIISNIQLYFAADKIGCPHALR